VKNSDFISLTNSNVSIGKGLFSHVKFSKGDIVAIFHGDIMSEEEYNDLEVTKGRGGYAIKILRDPITKIERVLNCYYKRLDGTCLASAANNGRNCINITTGKPAINNCRLLVNCKDEVKLICNIHKIAPHTEIAWAYGREYRHYD
jgi:hypothetical protein